MLRPYASTLHLPAGLEHSTYYVAQLETVAPSCVHMPTELFDLAGGYRERATKGLDQLQIPTPDLREKAFLAQTRVTQGCGDRERIPSGRLG
jgi:hypothetical protein